MMFHMLHEMLTTLVINVLCNFIYVNLLKQLKFFNISFIVQSMLLNIEAKW
jgi:uncharacterized membrane protein